MKINFRFIGALALAAALPIFLSGCLNEKKIREEVLNVTPVGSNFEKVFEECKRRWVDCTVKRNAGYYNEETRKAVVVQAIYSSISEKKISSNASQSGAIYWGFDKDGMLIDVYVAVSIDSL